MPEARARDGDGDGDADAGSDTSGSAPIPAPPQTLRAALWRLVASTVGACLRYRVTGLAAEAAFFAILSLPPLVFGLAGTIGYLADRYAVAEVQSFEAQILDATRQALAEDTVNSVIQPTVEQVLQGGRVDVISLGFVLALWSGSRALNVFIDTITIMYGLGGRRGIVRTRALSFSLYVVALLLGIVVVPLVLAGPTLVADLLPDRVGWLGNFYWPTVLLLMVGFITTLYHLSVPVRTSWRYDVPGAVLTVLVWIGGSWVLREFLQRVVGENSGSIYGPLAAPIVVLIWLYILSIAVLIGAALNSSFDRVFPEKTTARARLELVRRLRDKAMAARMREAGLDDRGLSVLTGAAQPGEHEARADLASHAHRLQLDEQARREGRQRDRSRSRLHRRRGDDDEPTRPTPTPVSPEDDTELVERPGPTR